MKIRTVPAILLLTAAVLWGVGVFFTLGDFSDLTYGLGLGAIILGAALATGVKLSSGLFDPSSLSPSERKHLEALGKQARKPSLPMWEASLYGLTVLLAASVFVGAHFGFFYNALSYPFFAFLIASIVTFFARRF